MIHLPPPPEPTFTLSAGPSLSQEFTFPNRTTFDAYLKFEEQHTQVALWAYRLARPAERVATAAELARQRRKAYKHWQERAASPAPQTAA